jgi:hypothetical protein
MSTVKYQDPGKGIDDGSQFRRSCRASSSLFYLLHVERLSLAKYAHYPHGFNPMVQ